MIAANDFVDPALLRMGPTQLRILIAQAGGLLAHQIGCSEAREAVLRVGWSIPATERLPQMPAIVEEVAKRHHLTVAELLGPNKARSVSRPRQEAYALCHATGKVSEPQIGAFFNRDPSTVHYGIQAHRRREAERMAAE